jgi:predicted nucleic acid-binding protein
MTSALVCAEVAEYIRDQPNFPDHHRALRDLLREISPIFLTYSILDRYGELRRRLRPPHGPGLIGDIDTLVAATALERDLTLVTTDTDFQRVPDLKVTVLPRASLRR